MQMGNIANMLHTQKRINKQFGRCLGSLAILSRANFHLRSHL